MTRDSQELPGVWDPGSEVWAGEICAARTGQAGDNPEPNPLGAKAAPACEELATMARTCTESGMAWSRVRGFAVGRAASPAGANNSRVPGAHLPRLLWGWCGLPCSDPSLSWGADSVRILMRVQNTEYRVC